MRTTVVIDDKLLKEAQEALGTKGVKETIDAGLQAVVRKRKREQLAALRGKVDLSITLEELLRLRREE